MSRYSSMRQEKYYQPWRLMVLRRRARPFGAAYLYYVIVLHNTATHETNVFTQDGDFALLDELGGAVVRRIGTKAQAMDMAKELAEVLGWPFDLSSDYRDYDDVVHGPVASCLVCGETFTGVHNRWHVRSHERVVCPTCRKAALAAKREGADTEEVALSIRPFDLPGNYHSYYLPSDNHYWGKEGAGELLARAVMGVAVPKENIENDNNVERVSGSGAGCALSYAELLAHRGHHFQVEARTDECRAVLVCVTCRQVIMSVEVKDYGETERVG